MVEEISSVGKIVMLQIINFEQIALFIINKITIKYIL